MLLPLTSWLPGLVVVVVVMVVPVAVVVIVIVVVVVLVGARGARVVLATVLSPCEAIAIVEVCVKCSFLLLSTRARWRWCVEKDFCEFQGRDLVFMQLLGKANQFINSDGRLLSSIRGRISAVPTVVRKADNLTVGLGNNINLSSRSDLRNFNNAHTLSLRNKPHQARTAISFLFTKQRHPFIMPPKGDSNGSGKRPPSTQRTDAKQTNKEEEMASVLLDLKALERVITEAQREAAALQERLENNEESGNARASRGNDPPTPEPSSMFARALAQVDRALIVRGLSYLDNALKVERLLRRET